MAVQNRVVKGDEWPSILDGERTDRGFEHFLRLTWTPNLALNDDFEVRLVVPRRETWIVEHMAWDWTGGDPVTWTSGEVLRELRQGQRKRYSPNPHDWLPMSVLEVIDRTLYTIPVADEELGNVNRSQMESDVCGVPGDTKWGFDWINITAAAATAELRLWLQVIRIPLAKERHWTEPDMKNALTRIEELARRVS